MSPVHISDVLLNILPSSELGLTDSRQPRAALPVVRERPEDGRRRRKGHWPCHSRSCSRRPEDTPASPANIAAYDRSGSAPGPFLPDRPFQTGPALTTALSSASDTASLSQSAGSNAAPSSAPSSAPGQSTPAESNSALTQPTSAPTESSSVPTQSNSALTESNSAPTQSNSAPTEPTSAPTMMSMQPTPTSAEPTSSSNPGFPQSQLSRNNPHVGAIVGGVLGGLLFIALVILAVWFFRRRQRRRVAPSAEFMGGTRPSFLPLDSEESLARDLRGRFGGATPSMTSLEVPKETV